MSKRLSEKCPKAGIDLRAVRESELQMADHEQISELFIR
jgi:hypothetical protein